MLAHIGIGDDERRLVDVLVSQFNILPVPRIGTVPGIGKFIGRQIATSCTSIGSIASRHANGSARPEGEVAICWHLVESGVVQLVCAWLSEGASSRGIRRDHRVVSRARRYRHPTPFKGFGHRESRTCFPFDDVPAVIVEVRALRFLC